MLVYIAAGDMCTAHIYAIRYIDARHRYVHLCMCIIAYFVCIFSHQFRSKSAESSYLPTKSFALVSPSLAWAPVSVVACFDKDFNLHAHQCFEPKITNLSFQI